MGNKQNIDASIIRRFLINPRVRTAFDDCFKLTNSLAINYLRHLRCRLQRIQSQYSNPDTIISDISIDVLGEFFQSKPGKPFFIIFDYFKRHGITTFDEIPDGDLIDHFRNLLFGFCRKKIGHLKAESEPQIANLKRRFYEIINEPPYSIVGMPGANDDYVCLEKYREQIPSDGRIIELTHLLDIVRKAFAESKTRTQLVLKIFELLENYTEYAPCIKKSDLIIALIEVNCSFVDDTYSDIPDKFGFEITRVRELGGKYLPELINNLKAKYIDRYIEKGKLGKKEADWILKAVSEYLEDFLGSGDTESIPSYFREHFPEEYHDQYATDYKYIFDTIFRTGKDGLIDFLEDNL